MLNDNIKALRLAKSKSQVEFAKAMGVTKQCVSNWENDNVIPSIDMLCKIANYFNVSTDFLLGRSQNRTIDVSCLTEEQISHIAYLVSSLSLLNDEKAAKPKRVK